MLESTASKSRHAASALIGVTARRKSKVCHISSMLAIGTADSVDESPPTERAVRWQAQNTGGFDERGHRLQSGIENVGDHSFAQIGIDIVGAGLPIDQRETHGEAGKTVTRAARRAHGSSAERSLSRRGERNLTSALSTAEAKPSKAARVAG